MTGRSSSNGNPGGRQETMSGEQLIGNAELGLGAEERPGERPESAAVSRRPAALLDRSEVERLSRRTDVHGIAYFLGHYALIGLGGWLCWMTFPGAAVLARVRVPGHRHRFPVLAPA